MNADVRRLTALWVYLASLPAVGLAAPAAAERRVIVTLEPPKLILGVDQQAIIRARVVDATGAAVERAEIRLRASVGTIAHVARSERGGVTAVYKPPKTYHPQIAMVMAVATEPSGAAHGWAALALWGQGQARVYSRPRVPVKVRIGDRVFGPMKTNRHGIAAIPVVVPPGITRARSGKRAIELHVPPVNRIAAVTERARLAADGSQSTSLRIYVVTPSGQPARDATVKAEATRGRVSDLALRSVGVFVARYTPPTQVGDGRDRVSVFLEGERASHDRLELEIVPGAPTRLEIIVEPVAYQAGRGEKVTVEARVFDAAGNPTPAEVSFDTDLGSIGPARLATTGRYLSELALPDAFGGRKQARVRVALPEGIQTEAAVALRAGAAKRIRFAKQREPILADGKTEVELVLTPLDDYDNAVPGVRLEASTTEGVVGDVLERGDGRYLARYTPPLRREPGYALLDATAGQAEARVRLELLDKAHLVSFSAVVGFLTNLVHLNAPFFAGEVSLNLPFLGRGFFLLAECGYYFYRREDARHRIKSSVGSVPITGSLAYRLELGHRLHLQAAVGGGASFVSSGMSIGDAPSEERRVVIGAAQANIEVGMRLGPGRAHLQIRYLHATPGGAAGITGNIGGLVILGGYELGLF